MSCEHDWEMTDADITGYWMELNTPYFSGSYRVVCRHCGETHEGDWDAQGLDLPFEGE